MKLVTRQQFADLCGTTTAVINTNISRGKIQVQSDDKSVLDKDAYINALFLKNRTKKSKDIKPDVKEIERLYNELVVPVESTPPPAAQPKKSSRSKKTVGEKQAEEATNWDLRKKIADAKKAEASAEKEELSVSKMMGQLMPVDMVEQILRVNIQHIIKEFENSSVNIASIFCDMLAGGNREVLADMISKLRLELQDSVRRVEEASSREIEGVINEYAETRNRGERK